MGLQFLRDSFIGQFARYFYQPSWLKYPEDDVAWIDELKSHADSSQKPKTIHVEWYGENDEENPQNWSQAKKAFVTAVIGLYSFVVYLSAPIYTPGLNAFIEEFNISNVEASLGLAIYVYVEIEGKPIYLSLHRDLPRAQS